LTWSRKQYTVDFTVRPHCSQCKPL